MNVIKVGLFEHLESAIQARVMVICHVVRKNGVPRNDLRIMPNTLTFKCEGYMPKDDDVVEGQVDGYMFRATPSEVDGEYVTYRLEVIV